MKKILLVCFCAFIYSQLFSSHIVGADFYYKYIGYNSGNNTQRYEITLKLYRTTTGTLFSSSYPIAVWRNSSVSPGTFNRYPSTTVCFTVDTVNTRTRLIYPPCGMSGTVIQEGTYKMSLNGSPAYLDLPNDTLDYYLGWGINALSSSILNIANPASTGISCYTKISKNNVYKNNNPNFYNTPIGYFCVGRTSYFNINAYDRDGDSLNYSLVQPYSVASANGTCASFYAPNPPNYIYTSSATGYSVPNYPLGTSSSVSINSSNGEISINPASVGVYIIAVAVKEYRYYNHQWVFICETRREIEIQTMNCSATNYQPYLSEIIPVKNANATTSQVVQAGDSICFKIKFKDINSGDSLFTSSTGALFDTASGINPAATCSKDVGIDSVVSNFCWSTNNSQGSKAPYIFTFSVNDNNCNTTERTFSILVKTNDSIPFTDFTASSVNTYIDTIIQLIDQSTKSPTTWKWVITPANYTFTTGTGSSQNPYLKFTDTGYYTVKLVCSNSYGADSLVKTKYIYVAKKYLYPRASFIASKTNSYPDTAIQFTDLSSNEPINWKWTISPATFTFINSTNSTSKNPAVKFTDTGYFTVKLVCWNPAGTDSIVKIDYIHISKYIFKPQANFIASKTFWYVDSLITLTDLSANSPTSWTWTITPNSFSYLGGSNNSTQNPSINFTDTGYFTVRLICSNSGGVDSVTKTNYIHIIKPGAKPQVDFIASKINSYIDTLIKLTDLTLNTPTTWQWSISPANYSFLNGTNSVSQNPELKFTDTGYYSVKLVASNANGMDSLLKTNYIHITKYVFKPQANFVASKTLSYVDSIIDFTDLSTNGPTGWKWTITPSLCIFVKGTTNTSQNPSVKFTDPGYYTVKLTCTNSAGSDSITKVNYILIIFPGPKPSVNFIASKNLTYINTLVKLTDLTANTPLTWKWTITPGTFTFLNSTNGSSKNPDVKFNDTGFYSVKLYCTNTFGVDSLTKTNYIRIQSLILKPQVNFISNKTNTFVDSAIQLTDLSTNTPTYWLWSITPTTYSYINSTTDLTQNPAVKFNDTGCYTFTLRCSNAGGIDSLTKTRYVCVTKFVGIQNYFSNTYLKVHPNPAGAYLILSTSYASIEFSTYTITNCVGQELLKGSIDKGETEINISGLAAGVYFIHSGVQFIRFVKE